MAEFVPWNSQPLRTWAQQFARGRFVQLDRYSAHYVQRGAGEPVVLVHGCFLDSCAWDRNMDVLARRFKVHALDLWGSGYSSREPKDHGYELYADQLLGFMDALAIDRASLVGHSLGGGVCIRFAARHRDRVNSLILVAASGLPHPLPALGRIAALPRAGEALMGLSSNLPRRMALRRLWFYDGALVTDEYFENVTRFHKVEGTTEVGLRLLRDHCSLGTLLDDIRRLGELRVPALIVWGRHDRAIPLEIGHQMQAILRGSRLEVIDRAGHCPQYEQSELFNGLALDFLSPRQTKQPLVERRIRRVLQ